MAPLARTSRRQHLAGAVRRFSLVIFDCDGVLVDSELLAAETLAETLTHHGRPTTLKEAIDRFLGRSFAAVADDYRAAVGRPLPGQFADNHAALLRARFDQTLRPIAGIAEALASLGAPYCLASSSGPERIAHCLRLAGLEQHFEGRIFHAAQVARGKPAPDLFLHAARHMGFDPATTLVIEDSHAGVAAARAAGMTVWGFTGGSHHRHLDGARQLVQAGAERVFSDMLALTLE